MRRGPVLLLALIVVIAMVSALWRYVAVGGGQSELLLAEIVGDVRIEGASGTIDAEPGTVLEASDRVATGPSSRAVLALGRDTRIRLGPASSVQVTGVDAAGVSLELENGALHATVRPESGAVTVGNKGRAVVATNGQFEAGVRDEVLQVRALEGDLSLSGVDVTRVAEGSQAVVLDRHAGVQPAPDQMLLAVNWPDEERTREARTLVQGQTTPGAQVRLTGAFGEHIVVAGADGVFMAEVPLVEGANEIEVEAVDPLGNLAQAEGRLEIRDTLGPSFRGGVEYGN